MPTNPTDITPTVDPKELAKAFVWTWDNPAVFSRVAAVTRLLQSSPGILPDLLSADSRLFEVLARLPVRGGRFDEAEIRAACKAGEHGAPPGSERLQ